MTMGRDVALGVIWSRSCFGEFRDEGNGTHNLYMIMIAGYAFECSSSKE